MKFDLSEAADMREAGIPVRAIAEKVGCSSSLVRQRLREVNPQRLKPGERRKLPRRYFDLETARQMREGGSSVKAIAEVLKFSSTIVRERLKEAGIDGPTKPRKSFDMERATALREGGSTIAEIAAATGIDGSTVHKRLAKAGVPVPPPKPRAPRVRPKFEPKITSPADTPPNPKRKLLNNVRRGKALSSGGCEPRATAVAPVGSSQGGLRRQRCRLKHSGDKGPRMAAQQPCGPEREVNAEQASKQLTQKPTLRCLGEGRWQIGKRATYAPICICRGSGASTHGR